MTPEDKARIKKAYRERAIAVEAVLPKRSFADPRITALQAENEKLREALLAHKEVAKDYADEALRLREALREIAAFSDTRACERLASTGSYSAFDEPGSVQTARAALGE